jgi:hypothetical protein
LCYRELLNKNRGLVADWTSYALIHLNNLSKKIETIFEELKQKIDIKRNRSDIPSQTTNGVGKER